LLHLILDLTTDLLTSVDPTPEILIDQIRSEPSNIRVQVPAPKSGLCPSVCDVQLRGNESWVERWGESHLSSTG
jgi:hypothetical protein